MSNVTLFDLDELTEPWEPIPAEFDETVHFAKAIASAAEWKRYIARTRCCECGGLIAKLQWSEPAAGGASHGVAWVVCDDCFPLRECARTGRHRWHAGRDHDDLARAQAKRRAAYLRSIR